MYIELQGIFVFKNIISISKSRIEHNQAKTGGGISLLAGYSLLINNITIRNSVFNYNSALSGAAMYLCSLTDNPWPLNLHLVISDTDFTNNVVEKVSLRASLLYPDIVYVYKLNVVFSGDSMLTNNNALAIGLYHSSLVLYNNSYCIFDNNTGDRGGAIALYDCSTIILHDNVQLVFNNNSADIGGAIYSGECSLPVCFIQYYQAHVNPEEWNVQLYFSDNTAATYGNAMYISNIVSCWPPNVTCSSIIDNVEIIKQTFCWNNTWHYSPGDCYSNVDTSILYYTSPLPSYTIYPGGELSLELELFDGQMQVLNKFYMYQLCISGPASLYDYSCSINCSYQQRCSCCKDFENNKSFNLYFDGSVQDCIRNNANHEIDLNIIFSSTAQCNMSNATVLV